MIGYKYNEFEIKKKFDAFKCTAWHIFKGNEIFSEMAFTKPFVAKKVLDLVFPKQKTDLKPFNYYQ